MFRHTNWTIPSPAAALKTAGYVLGLGLLASVAVVSTASALPVFTLNPLGAAPPLAGSPVTADNIIVSDFSTVRLSGSSFTDTGFLSVQSFQLGGNTVVAPGLNSGYSLYFQFTASGTTSVPGNLTTAPSAGNFTSLTYTLFGAQGPTTFGFDGNDNPTVSGAAGFALATGTLRNGIVGTQPTQNSQGGPAFIPTASANLNFVPANNETAFFAAPNPFYNLAITSFINTTSEVQQLTPTSFKIVQGGGSVNFDSLVTQVPEPASLSLLGAGLVAIGAIRRRSRSKA